MHAAIMVMNDMPVGALHREVADHKGPAGHADEEPQQRFADMLPLVSTQERITPDKSLAEEASPANERGSTQTTVDVAVAKGPSPRENEETPAVGMDLPGWDLPGRTPVEPGATKAGAGKAAPAHTQQSEAPRQQTPPGNRAAAGAQVASGKEFTVGGVQVAAPAQTACRVKGSAHASETAAGTEKPVGPKSLQVPGRAAGSQTAASVARGAEATTRAAVAKERPDGIADPQVQVARLKDAGLSKPASTTAANEASSKVRKDGPGVRPEIAPASASETATSSQRLSVQGQGGADGSALRSLTRDIGAQILDSVHASLARGDRQITIRLRPPELGTILVRFREQGEYISGLLEVGKSGIRHEIEQALPQVLRSLQDAGVQIRRFDVMTSDQPQRDFAGDQMDQDAWARHSSGHGRDPLWAPAQAHRPQGDAGRSAGSQEEQNSRQQAAAPGGINLLL